MSTVFANPLLKQSEFPLFSDIRAEDVEPAIRQLIKDINKHRAELLTIIKEPTWDNLLAPLEEQSDKLDKAWALVSHLHSVADNEQLRDAYTKSLVPLTDYYTQLGQDEKLYEAYQAIAESTAFKQLNQAQQQTIMNGLRDFRLSGVALSGENKKRYAEIKQRLSELATEFSNHVLDATQAWYKLFPTKDALAGLPQFELAQAAQAAQQRNKEGYLITLDYSSYDAVITYADDRDLRQEIYTAYVTRASAQSKIVDENSETIIESDKFDNTQIIAEILSLRHELALLLGNNNYAELSLAKKMAESTEQVLDFLHELVEKSKSYAEHDYLELKIYAEEKGCADLQSWDFNYYSEKLYEKKYALSQQEIRRHFPVEKVIAGMFQIVSRLFAIEIEQIQNFDSYHPDVRFYRIHKNVKTIAYFYLDLFEREKKKSGAWMAECRARRNTEQGIQIPVVFLTCNFISPLPDMASLLSHDQVTTLFHEFGHGLHHMLTQIDVAAVSGINGVAWDAVELPSQFMENWCWEPEAIPLISGHYKTNEPLPEALLEKMLAAKNFQSGLQMIRQLEFALFDFRLHAEYDPDKPKSAHQLLQEVRDQVAVIKPPAFNRFENSFGHIFAGGYAAGYYSYKWAEVLSADAYSRFEEEGIFNAQTGHAFLTTILQQGGSRLAMDLFKEFRGREPQIDALLKHSGFNKEAIYEL
jgi:oligopeptidase A